MKVDLDTFEEIIVTITRNKTRSLLTAFGVFWGIFMLMALVGGGQGLKNLMESNFEGFAQNSGFFFPQNTSKAYKGFNKGRSWNITWDDVKRVSKVDGVEVSTATISTWGATTTYHDKKVDGVIKGCFPEYKAIEDPKIKYGRFINDIDIKEKRKVCFIGNKISNDLFGEGVNPCGKFIQVGGAYFQVIGTSGSKGGNISINGDASEAITIPLSTFATLYNTGDNAGLLCITAEKGYKISELQPRIEQLLKKHHLIHPDDKQAVMLLNTEAMFGMVDNLFEGINILVWMVGLGTLIAGAIGVSNIMMVTVKERTTEIGIRRAIGATPKVIMGQIMTESLLLTLMAGLFGISFSVMILQLMDTVMQMSGSTAAFQVDFWTAIGTTLILVILGTFAGLAPAYRAMSVKPVDAMRDE